MRSGLSFADEDAFMAIDEIRPFSTFASIPEFTLFISIFLFYFSIKKQYLNLFFSFFMLYISGSRGVIISTLLSYFFVFILKKVAKKDLITTSIISLLTFLFLVYLFPLLFITTEFGARIFAYGTFNGRIELLKTVIDRFSWKSIFLGVDLKGLNITFTFDNLYFMLISNFGIFALIYFLYYMVTKKINAKSFYFLTIFIGYGFYADMIFSYYLMFLFFFALYSSDQDINYLNGI
jgi:hypothetical protein